LPLCAGCSDPRRTTRYRQASLEWAQRWPSEEVWKVRKR
jgi:hypothetical protein